MASYETEEEQLEALRKWWQENARAVITGVIIGVGAVGGWRGWIFYQESRAESASVIYQSLLQDLESNAAAAVQEKTTQLIDDYSGTPYAELAALGAARVAVSQQDFAAARERLEWVRDNARQQDLRQIARLRLARVLAEEGAHDAALSELAGDFPDAFLAAAQELRGDVLLAQGEREAALEAYRKALLAPFSSGDRDVLEMKVNELQPAGDPGS